MTTPPDTSPSPDVPPLILLSSPTVTSLSFGTVIPLPPAPFVEPPPVILPAPFTLRLSSEEMP